MLDHAFQRRREIERMLLSGKRLTVPTTDNLISTIKNMNVTNIHDVEYMALYNGSRTLDALTQMTSMDLDRLHSRPQDLNGMIKKILT